MDIFPDIFSVTEGVRDAAIVGLDNFDAGFISSLKKRCEKSGLVFKTVDVRAYYREREMTPITPEKMLGFISPSGGIVSSLIDAYLKGGSRTTGTLLGYPGCCIDAMLSGGNHLESSFDRSGEFSSWLNIFSDGNRLIPHVPCSFDCEESIRIAKRIFSGLKKIDPNRASAIKQELNRTSKVKNREIVWDDLIE